MNEEVHWNNIASRYEDEILMFSNPIERKFFPDILRSTRTGLTPQLILVAA